MENKEPKYKGLKEKLDKKGEKYTIIFADDIEIYVKPIGRNTLKKVSRLLESKPVQAFEIILRDIFIGGDKDVFDDVDVFLSVMQPIMSELEPYELTVDVKKDNNGKKRYDCVIKDNKKELAKFSLKPITIQLLSDVLDSYNKGDYFGAAETVLNKCWIEGDEKVKTDNRLFLSAIPVIEKMIQLKQVTIKKN